jgi:hypothetical protein
MQPPVTVMAEVAASMRTRVRLRERILVFLGVCLPVPVFAATGLSIPLPGPVARMAVELVPFADVATFAEDTNPTRGAIVLTQAERGRLVRVVPTPSAPVRVEAPASPGRAGERRKDVPGPRRPAAPERKETRPARTKPPAPPVPGRPPAPTPVAPIEDAPAAGTDKPRPAVRSQPKPDREARPKPKPKPEPGPRRPEPKPKPEPEQKKPRPQPDPRPQPGPRPQPEPKPPPAPETSPAAGREMVEKDTGVRAGKPSDAAPTLSSADGR